MNARRQKSELSPELIRRVLVATQFEYCEELFWREENGMLRLYANCSDLFGWATADYEPIETEADVALLEQTKADLAAATSAEFPPWVCELYAARRRESPVADYMYRHFEKLGIAELFRSAAAVQETELEGPS